MLGQQEGGREARPRFCCIILQISLTGRKVRRSTTYDVYSKGDCCWEDLNLNTRLKGGAVKRCSGPESNEGHNNRDTSAPSFSSRLEDRVSRRKFDPWEGRL